jgi:hypothetical protein
MFKLGNEVEPRLSNDNNYEQTSLLSTEFSDQEISQKQKDCEESTKKRAYLLICIVIILIQIGTCLQRSPMIELYESIICRNVDRSPHAREIPSASNDNCKSVPVQSELALIRAWQMVFEQLPGEGYFQLLLRKKHCLHYC